MTPPGPDDLAARIRRAARQEQFLEVLEPEEARRRFHAALSLTPLPAETVPLADSPGRVLAETLRARQDAPPFDRALVDGFAVRAADSLGASAGAPARLRLNPEVLACGVVPGIAVAPGTATAIATGGVLPRGADAVAMIEWTELEETGDGPRVRLDRPLAAGRFVGFAGGDVARGAVVLRRGAVVGAREVGILAASGHGAVPVVRRPVVAVLSTGDELVPPGAPLPPAGIPDSNGAILAALAAEHGAAVRRCGIVPDDPAALAAALAAALRGADMVVLSGGTSKGAGDVSHRVLEGLGPPGVLVHGVALKPGKPLCLAVSGGVPVLVLPGFPTSAVFTFREYAVPVLRAFAGLPARDERDLPATLAVPAPSEAGRREYVMAALAEGPDGGLAAWPVGKGSGAVTTFSAADGFFPVPALSAGLAAGERVSVSLLGDGRPPALTLIGSHCLGLDAVLDRLGGDLAARTRVLAAGSLGGVAAARRGACDLAPVHLLDPATGAYNTPWATDGLALVPGWRRAQGIVFRPGDARFEGRPAAEAVRDAAADPGCLMVNRNAGSGTRLLTDGLLAGARPAGHANQPGSHNAVAARVAQGRADWGMAIAPVAAAYGLGFLPVADERYDFLLPATRAGRPAVRAFLAALADPGTADALRALGFAPA